MGDTDGDGHADCHSVDDLRDKGELMMVGQIYARLMETDAIDAIIAFASGLVPFASYAAARAARGNFIGISAFDVSQNLLHSVSDGDVTSTISQGEYFQGYVSLVLLDVFARRGTVPRDVVFETGPQVLKPTGVALELKAESARTHLYPICAAGTTLSDMPRSAAVTKTCVPCVLGRFQPLADGSACLPCPAGTAFSLTGAADVSACGLCAAEMAAAEPGSVACVAGLDLCVEYDNGERRCPIGLTLTEPTKGLGALITAWRQSEPTHLRPAASLEVGFWYAVSLSGIVIFVLVTLLAAFDDTLDCHCFSVKSPEYMRRIPTHTLLKQADLTRKPALVLLRDADKDRQFAAHALEPASCHTQPRAF